MSMDNSLKETLAFCYFDDVVDAIGEDEFINCVYQMMNTDAVAELLAYICCDYELPFVDMAYHDTYGDEG